MADVVRWVDTQEVAEVAAILEAAGVPEALQAARASWRRDDRQRSSVYTTAETVLEPFAEPVPAPPGGPGRPRPARHRPGGPPRRPPHAVRVRAGPRAAAAAGPVHRRGQAGARRRLHPLGGGRPAAHPPLLVVLDEAANIAPLPELDGLAATCSGHGVQLVTVWQDLAQVQARYGERAATVVNNHRAKLFLSGTADPRTLDQASHLAGDEELLIPSVTRDPTGAHSVTGSPALRRLLAPDALRRLPPGTGVLVYGALPPVRLSLRPWFADPVLATGPARHRGRPARHRGRPARHRGRPARQLRIGRGAGRMGRCRPALRTERLTKRYGEIDALRDLDLEVAPGEVVGCLGPNGAGKTTTVRLVLGLIRPSGGRAEVFGLDCQRQAVEAHRRLGYVAGEASLWPG